MSFLVQKLKSSLPLPYTRASPWRDTIYDSLLNPFGETLHVETHSVFDEVLGIFSAFMAVAVSAGRSLSAITGVARRTQTSPIQEDAGGATPTISGDSHHD